MQSLLWVGAPRCRHCNEHTPPESEDHSKGSEPSGRGSDERSRQQHQVRNSAVVRQAVCPSRASEVDEMELQR